MIAGADAVLHKILAHVGGVQIGSSYQSTRKTGQFQNAFQVQVPFKIILFVCSSVNTVQYFFKRFTDMIRSGNRKRNHKCRMMIQFLGMMVVWILSAIVFSSSAEPQISHATRRSTGRDLAQNPAQWL